MNLDIEKKQNKEFEEKENLEKALQHYIAKDFKDGGIVLYWLAKLVLNIFYNQKDCDKTSSNSQHQPNLEDEPLITVQEFCNSLIVEKKLLIFPSNLIHLLNKDRKYFDGCYYQSVKKSPIKIYREKMIKKLATHPFSSTIVKTYFENQEKENGQTNKKT